jgi:hypothetical protein
MADVTITIPASGSPATPNTKAKKKVCWYNGSGKEVTAFALPTCVSPQTSPAPIAIGATTRDFEINEGANGSYGYTFVVAGGRKKDPRSGTIDVGSRRR